MPLDLNGNIITSDSVSSGYFKNNLTTNGLILHLDAGNKNSYSGSGTTWYDLSSYGTNGTLLNGVGFSSSNGGCLSFDGADDYATISSYSNINLNEGTVCAWVKYTNITTNRVVVSYGGNGSNTGFLLQNENDVSNKFGFSTVRSTWSSTYVGNTVSSPLVNTWIYQVGWYTPTQNKIFINGYLYNMTTATSAPLSASTNLWIGNEPNRSYYFVGNIGAVHIYNRALPTAEILNNYYATKTRFGL
jgi:hypothetical protein